MKVFVGADIEGIADLTAFKEVSSENMQLYTRSMIQMSMEVGAACRGAEKAGADLIVVKDAHGDGLNIMHEYLPEQANLIRGEVRNPFSMIGGIDKSYDAILFIGYHDAAGEDGNPMSHTISSRRIRQITINSIPTAEMHIFAYAAAYLGVPTVLVVGDEGICAKAKRLQPEIRTVAIKKGIGAAVMSLHPKRVEKLIEAETQKALSGDLSRYRISLPKQFHVTVSYVKHFDAETKSYYPGTHKIDASTISYDADDYYEVLRFFHFVL